MSDLLELIDIKGIIDLIESIGNFGHKLINLFGQVFSWLGPDVLIALGIGITIAIVLRILGR